MDLTARVPGAQHFADQQVELERALQRRELKLARVLDEMENDLRFEGGVELARLEEMNTFLQQFKDQSIRDEATRERIQRLRGYVDTRLSDIREGRTPFSSSFEEGAYGTWKMRPADGKTDAGVGPRPIGPRYAQRAQARAGAGAHKRMFMASQVPTLTLSQPPVRRVDLAAYNGNSSKRSPTCCLKPDVFR